MKKIKILFHDAYFDSFEGAQKSLLLLVKNLNKERFDVTVLLDSRGILSEKFEEVGIKVNILPTPTILKSFNKKLLKTNIILKILIFLFVIIPHNLRLLFYLKRNHIDIVHLNSIRSLLVVGFAPYLMRIPIVLHIRGNFDVGRLFKLIAKIMSTKIIFCAKNIVSVYEPINKKKYVIIYNGIDCNENAFKANKTDGEKDKIIIGNVGSVVPYKGQDFLIKSVYLVKKKFPNILCYIVGKQPDKNWKNYLDDLIKKYDLKKHVIFTGPVYPPFAIMSKFDIFVLPSLNEGLSRSILEAMCLRKPVIATDVGGNSELVKDKETGLLVRPKDEIDLYESIIYLIEHSKEREKLGNNGFKYVRENFTIKQMVEKCEELYYYLLSRR